MGGRRIGAAAPATALIVIAGLAGFAANDGGARHRNAQRVHADELRLGSGAVGSGLRAGHEARLRADPNSPYAGGELSEPGAVLLGSVAAPDDGPGGNSPGGNSPGGNSSGGNSSGGSGSGGNSSGGNSSGGNSSGGSGSGGSGSGGNSSGGDGGGAADEPEPGGPWHQDHPGVTVSLVRGLSPARAVRAMHPEGLHERASLEAADAAAYREDGESGTEPFGWIAAGTIDGWTFVWEDNGFAGSDLDTAARVSRRGRLISVYWDAKGNTDFTVAERGRVARQFDPLFHDDDPDNTIGRPLRAEAGFDWSDDADQVASMLALQSRLTGAPQADPDWLDRPGVRFWTYQM